MIRIRLLILPTIFGLILWLSESAPTAVAQYQQFPKLCNVKDFDDFLQQTGKVYTDENERRFREALFYSKKNLVDYTNQIADRNGSSFRMAINTLADRTKEEVSHMTGSKISRPGEDITVKHRNYVATQPQGGLPDMFDWREKGGVTPARFQGFDCGACWSFATIGALEGHLFRRTGYLVPLSEQNLIDCADQYGNMGCDGGFQEYGFEYIRDYGVQLQKAYPYTQMEHPTCDRNPSGGKGVRIRDYGRIEPGNEERMKEVIASLGPLACSMNAATVSFEQYMSGVYDDDECNKEDVNHSVVVVGYGTENGKDYWIIKNSYSENWGEDGFMKLLRNANSFCGIADECSYPIL